MGNVFDIVLTVPFDVSTDVADGLRELGFHPAAGYREVLDLAVWTRLDLKLPARMSLDLPGGLKDAVLALPWAAHERRSPGYDLQVLWRDEYTSEDDSWGGRVSPYGWNHDVWAVRA